jgi:hypothetical protein
MLLEADPDDLRKEIGHSDLEVRWPDLPGAMKYRSYHIQEILDLFIRRGKYLCPIELEPRLGHDQEHWFDTITGDKAIERFHRLLAGKEGFLITPSHVMVWTDNTVYDPNGRWMNVIPPEVFECWIVI